MARRVLRVLRVLRVQTVWEVLVVLQAQLGRPVRQQPERKVHLAHLERMEWEGQVVQQALQDHLVLKAHLDHLERMVWEVLVGQPAQLDLPARMDHRVQLV